jgi:hypothetical protein
MKPHPERMAEAGRPDRVGRRVVSDGVDEDGAGDEVDLGGFESEDTGGRPSPIGDSMKTAEIDFGRDGRITLISPIPAQIAEDMRSGLAGESTDERAGLGSQPSAFTSAEAGIAARRLRAAALIDDARAALDSGDVTAAASAAEAALRESDDAPAPGIVEVIEPARPLLARVFAAYVGPLSGVPVLAPRAQEIARIRLGERERELISRIDGSRTLGDLFAGSGIGSTDALRIAARLVRAGAVRLM